MTNYLSGKKAQEVSVGTMLSLLLSKRILDRGVQASHARD